MILSLPALRALREAHRGSFVTVIANPAYFELLNGRYYADRVLSIDRADVSACLAGRPRGGDGVEFLFREADLVVNWLPGPSDEFSIRLAGLGPGRLLSAAPVRRPAGGRHRTEIFFDAIGRAPKGDETDHPTLFPSEADREAGRQALGRLGLTGLPLIAIQPGSGSPSKCWPAERYVSLASRLRERLGLIPVFFLGPAEGRSSLKPVGGELSSFPVVRDLPLPALSGALQQCRVYVGNDSGVTHLAASLGLATIALFGPTDPAEWGPRGARVTILSRHGPCGRDGERPAEPCRCLERIPVEEVYEGICAACMAGDAGR